MTWLAWRQFRVPAGVAAVALAALGVLVFVTGRQLVSVYDTSGVATCDARGTACVLPDAWKQYALLGQLFHFGLLAAPAIIGVFWGAPLVARELETGTYRLAWTQSVSRTRWLAIKLATVGLASMVAAGMLSFMVSWWSRPLDWWNGNRFDPGTFDERGIVAVGYAAFALALGVTAGLVIRRTLPAMAVTLAAFVGVRLAFTEWVRPHLWTPAHTIGPLNADFIEFHAGRSGVTFAARTDQTASALSNAWLYSTQVVDNTGRAPTAAALHSFLQSACPSIASGSGADPSAKGVRAGDPGAFQACISQMSTQFHQVVTYQPASRFWAFQWGETAIFLSLALLLAAFCVWWIRERAS